MTSAAPYVYADNSRSEAMQLRVQHPLDGITLCTENLSSRSYIIEIAAGSRPANSIYTSIPVLQSALFYTQHVQAVQRFHTVLRCRLLFIFLKVS